jgi:hypothetical protein
VFELIAEASFEGRVPECALDGCPPDDELDGALERLLADAETYAEWAPWPPPRLPDGAARAGGVDGIDGIDGIDDGAPPPAFGAGEPSGWLASPFTSPAAPPPPASRSPAGCAPPCPTPTPSIRPRSDPIRSDPR